MLAASTLVAATAAAAADDGDVFSQGVHALRRGLHAKAWELLRTHYRSLSPAEAWASRPLQESLCVCAVKMRKTAVAISACRNASELRSPGHVPPASLSLLMARGEARMLAGEPAQAWDEFREARDTAARGEALKQEREAEEAMRRCEQAILVSYTRQRGAVVTTSRAQELKRGSFASLADAMAACTATPGCGAVGAKLLPKADADGSIRAALYNSTTVRGDTHVKPSLRQVAYVRDAPACAYRARLGALVAGVF